MRTTSEVIKGNRIEMTSKYDNDLGSHHYFYHPYL